MATSARMAPRDSSCDEYAGSLFSGPFVEQTLGPVKYGITYFTAGIASMSAVTFLTMKGYLNADLLVGASGAIMGLIGATAAVFFKMWRKEKTRFASERLRSIGFAFAHSSGLRLEYSTSQLYGALCGDADGALVGTNLLEHLKKGQMRLTTRRFET